MTITLIDYCSIEKKEIGYEIMAKGQIGVTRLQVLGAISDNISADMFRLIATNSETPVSLMDKLGVSHKQYYDRLSKLYRAGLIRRRDREYAITSFGRLVYGIQTDFVKATDYSLKLKAVDTIMTNNSISRDQYMNLVDELIDDTQLRNIVINLINPIS
jgi:hypothetical protein